MTLYIGSVIEWQPIEVYEMYSIDYILTLSILHAFNLRDQNLPDTSSVCI